MQMQFVALFHVLCLLLIITIAPAYAQNRWDGADNLPVDPLACPADREDAPELQTGRYDGGQPSNAADLAGQPITVVDVRPPVSPDYDSALERGMAAAAAELRNVELINGSASVVSLNQQAALDEFVYRGVNGILFAAADQEDIAANLETALRSGIRTIGYGADTTRSAREWFVQPAAYNAVASALVDNLVAQAGENAGIAILTTGFDSPQTGRWIAEIWAYASACYPQLEWLETVETQGDAVLAYNQAALLISEYSGDLGGIISVTPLATPQAAQAVAQANACAAVAVVGLATPNSIKPFINSGCVQAAVLWEPSDLGYAAVYAIRAVIDGELQPGASEFAAGRLGVLPIVNGSEILLGEPLVFGANNINNFDF